MNPLPLYIDGLAWWTPQLPSWSAARAAFRNEGVCVDTAWRRPSPQLLAPNERRRAPDTVAVALEVATCAVMQSGHAEIDLRSVFTSSQGDMAVNDAMCAALARTPTLISPTQFHHSVHNAASGYWAQATGCMHASTALSALDCSFTNGLLEALVQCAAYEQAVLLVGYDMPPSGALKSVSRSTTLLGAAFVLAPQRSAHSQFELQWQLQRQTSSTSTLRSAAAQTLADHALADCLPLLEVFASDSPATLSLPISTSLAPAGLELAVAVEPCASRL